MYWRGAAALLLGASTQIAQAAAQVITITQYPSTCSAIYTSERRSVTIVQSTVTVSPIPWNDNSANTGQTFVLQALPDSGARTNGVPRWVLPNGQLTTDGTKAAQYTIKNGQLTTSAGWISTFEGIPYGTFGVSSTIGNINTVFRVVNGKLVWSNGNFTDGAADFYQTPDGVQDPSHIVAIFYGNPNDAWIPNSLYARPVNAATQGTSPLPAMSSTTMVSSAGDGMTSMQPPISNSPYRTPTYSYQPTTGGQGGQSTNGGSGGVPTTVMESPTTGGQGGQPTTASQSGMPLVSSGGAASSSPGGQTMQPSGSMAQSSPLAPSPPRPISPDGICGGMSSFYCANGFCCGQYGYCGVELAYCGPGCQTGFGNCWAVSMSYSSGMSGTPASSSMNSMMFFPDSSAAATTSSTSPEGPIPTVATCPDDDGELITDEYGNQYTLGCGEDTTIGSYASRTVEGGFNECFRLCGRAAECQAFTYHGGVNGIGPGICYSKRLGDGGTPSELVEVDNGERMVGAIKENAAPSATPSSSMASSAGSTPISTTYTTYTGPSTLIGPDNPGGPPSRTPSSSAMTSIMSSMSVSMPISVPLSVSGSVTVTMSMSPNISSMSPSMSPSMSMSVSMSMSMSGMSSSASATLSTMPISPNGHCGIEGNGGSPEGFTCTDSLFGPCCSFSGFCGYSSNYCLGGCQEEYGECTAQDGNPITDSGSCGMAWGNQTCTGGIFGHCCSTSGFCGFDSDYCAPDNCDPEFGTCDENGSISATMMSSTSLPMPMSSSMMGMSTSSPGMMTSTPLSTRTMSSTTSPGLPAASSVCPGANSTTYTDPSGSQYTILCGMGFAPETCTPRPALSLLLCVDLCLHRTDATCLGVTFELGQCCLKSRFADATMTPGMDSAVAIDVYMGSSPLPYASSSTSMVTSSRSSVNMSSSSSSSMMASSSPSSSSSQASSTSSSSSSSSAAASSTSSSSSPARTTTTTTCTMRTTTTTSTFGPAITTTTTSTTRTTTTTTTTSSSASPYLVLPSPTPCDFGDPPGYDEDDSYCKITLPFAMRMYAQSDVNTFAATNGFLSLTVGSGQYASQQFPASNLPNNTVAPFFDDTYLYYVSKPKQGIFYQIQGTAVTYEWYIGRGGAADAIYHYTVRYDNTVPGVFTIRYYSTGGTDDQGISSSTGSQGKNSTGTIIGNTYAYHVQSIAPGLVVVCDTNQNTCVTGT